MAVRRLLPVDLVTAGYNAALAMIWMQHTHRLDAAWGIAAAHAAGVALPWLLLRAQHASSFTRVLADMYPLILIGAFWTELDLLRMFAPRSFDAVVAGWDLAVFGRYLHDALPAMLSSRWIVELIFFSYFAYYAVLAGPPLVLLFRGKRDSLRTLMLHLMVVSVGCYLAFIFFPVDGPQHFLPAKPGVVPEGFFPTIVAGVRESGGSLGASFPSSHAAISVTAAYVGWRVFRPWAAVILTIEAALVSVATFFTQNHFAIDAVAGIAWALAAVTIVMPTFSRVAEGYRRAPRPVRLGLPVPAPDSGVTS